MTRGRTSLSQRLGRLRAKSWAVGQCAVAAMIAWYVAHDLIGHAFPVFAPSAAVIALGTSYGQRLRRVAEVTVGVAVGVFVGDLLTHWLGSGGWQIALIVVLAMSTALLLDAGTIMVTQSAVQAVVVSVLLPLPGGAFSRWTDALVGGGVALIAATIVPRAALRRPREVAAGVVRRLAALCRAASDCLADGDAQHALAVLDEARDTDDLVAELRAAANEGLSVVASSPFRRRRHGIGLRQMADLVEPLDFAIRNTRVLVRRVAVAAYRRERVPASYAALLEDLAASADLVADELEADRMASAAIGSLIALGWATTELERSQDLSAEVILAQVRSIIADLLAVAGMDPLEATDAIPLI